MGLLLISDGLCIENRAAAGMVRSPGAFCIENDGLCVENDGVCIKKWWILYEK